MSALPDNPTEPAVAATSHDTESQEEPRHLHAVPLAETATDTEIVEPEPEVPLDQANTNTRAAETFAWLREAFTPDSGLYADRQPSIAETMLRAHHGDQLSAVGPLRTVAKGHGYLAAANKAAMHTWVWIVDHPARLAVVTALLTLAIAYPPTRHLIGYLLTPFAWAHQALLD